jgi:hypothetical protein
VQVALLYEDLLKAECGLQSMPLDFESLSHGTVAFGFFNIESDLLLLERSFFFASEFCELVDYVWRGGYPRWEDEVRPDYVLAMAQAVQASRHPYFNRLSNRVRTGPRAEAKGKPPHGKLDP